MASHPLSLVELHRPSAAATLQTQLRDSEQQIDQSLINTGELIGKTIRAAAEAGVHRTAIHRMLLRLHSSMGHSFKAQWDLQIFHQQCREQLKKLDLDTLGWGDTGGTPQMAPDTFAAAEAEASA